MTNISVAGKEVFWDFDGTLFDSYPFTISAIQKVLHAHSIEIADEELHQRFMAMMYPVLQEIIVENHSDCTMDEFTAAIRSVDPSLFPLYPHVKEVLQYIVDTGGHNYLLTHRDASAFTAIKHAGIASCFRDYITSESDYPRKPDPSSLLAMVQKYHLSLSDVVVIGDRELEINLARNAGVPVIFYASNPVPPKTSPDMIIQDYKEILPR